MAGFDEPVVDLAPGFRIGKGTRETGPVHHHDLLRVAEAWPDLSEIGVALLDALDGIDDTDCGAVDIAAAKIEQQALSNSHKPQDDDVVRPEGGGVRRAVPDGQGRPGARVIVRRACKPHKLGRLRQAGVGVTTSP